MAVSPRSSTPPKDWKALIYCPPPPSPDGFLLYSTLYQRAPSHLPRAARLAVWQTCCFCPTNAAAAPASQSKLTSKDVNGRVRNQLTNSDTLISGMRAEAKLLWTSGFTSTNGFLSTGYQPVETRTTFVTLSLLNTHITVDCVHVLRPWWISFTHTPQPLPPDSFFCYSSPG